MKNKNTVKYDWTIDEIRDIYEMPLLELISKTHTQIGSIQLCHLISIKTGGCPEDCKYCAQSSRYQTSVKATPLMDYEEVMAKAKKAIERGVTRICLGAALREVKDNKLFDEILILIKGVADLGVEVCCTLGMLNEKQAARLKEAGLYAYNHNLDTSEKFYKTIITTRTYQDRLNTLDTVAKTGLKVCCGAILGLGESIEDRLELLQTLSARNPHPHSVPINLLSPIPGTPLADQPKVPFWEFLRMIAAARIILPQSAIRLSCGRVDLSFEQQALCFLAGANSIHEGEKLLTIGNTPVDKDEEMFKLFGIKKRPAYAD